MTVLIQAAGVTVTTLLPVSFYLSTVVRSPIVCCITSRFPPAHFRLKNHDFWSFRVAVLTQAVVVVEFADLLVFLVLSLFLSQEMLPLLACLSCHVSQSSTHPILLCVLVDA